MWLEKLLWLFFCQIWTSNCTKMINENLHKWHFKLDWVMSASSRIHEGMTFVVITTFVTEFFKDSLRLCWFITYERRRFLPLERPTGGLDKYIPKWSLKGSFNPFWSSQLGWQICVNICFWQPGWSSNPKHWSTNSSQEILRVAEKKLSLGNGVTARHLPPRYLAYAGR